MKIFTCIIAFAVQLLPQFEGSPDILEMGDKAAHLGLSISDPVETISCKAREGMYWLAQILLHQRATPANHLNPDSTSLSKYDLTTSLVATERSCNSAKATTQVTD